MPGPIGATTVTDIDDASLVFIQRMDETREHKGVMNKVGRQLTIPPGYGLQARLPYTGALTIAPIIDGEPFMSAQRFTDTPVAISASRSGVQTLISTFSNQQVSKVVNLFAHAGGKMAAAMAYGIDRSGILAAQGYGGIFGGASTTLVIGHLDSAMTAITTGLAQSGATARTGARDTGDPSESPLFAVLHDRQIRAIRAQLSGLFSGSSDGSLTSVTPAMDRGTNRFGMTPMQWQWVLTHFRGQPKNMGNVTVLADNNISITGGGTPYAKGFILERDSFVMLGYDRPHHADKETEDGLYHRLTEADAWGWGITKDAGGYVIQSAAPAFTS
jgi:hypothetical protein